ncbi:MAG: DUF3604 domain-containing protein [Spirochaetota bacterium]
METYNNQKVYFADLHNHCNISYGHGSLHDALKNGRQRLDICSITGHAHWPDMPARDGKIDHIIDFHEKGFSKLKSGWPEVLRILQAYNQEGGYLVFPGFEIHSMDAGDYTLVSKRFDAEIMYPDSIEELRNLLASRPELRSRYLAFPHHIGYAAGRRGINWKKFSGEVFPLVEIYSMHGCAETDENDHPFLHTMGPGSGVGTMRYGLGPAGARFGVLGNTDHHSAHPGSYGHGFSGVWAESLEREAIWEALHQRRTYALTADKMELKFAVNGAAMGSSAPLQAAQKIEFELKAGGALDYVDIIKNGNLLSRYSQPDFPPYAASEHTGSSARGTVHTLLFLELGWGERNKQFNWDVQFGIDRGRIAAVDARFRGGEVVSPLDAAEGSGSNFCSAWDQVDETRVNFVTKTFGNPTNSTSATQGMALEVEADPQAEISVIINDKTHQISLQDLRQRAFVGYTGGFDSPAFKLHRAPGKEEFVWSGWLQDHDPSPGYYYLRGRQQNGAWVWSSPVWLE